MQSGDLRFQCKNVPVINDYIIGYREALLTRRLRCHDCAYLLLRQPAATRHPSYLRLFIAINYQYTGNTLLPGAGFDQQRNNKYQIRSLRIGGRTFCFGSYQRMQDGLKSRFGDRIRKYVCPHLGAIQRAPVGEECIAELCADLRNRNAAFRRQ